MLRDGVIGRIGCHADGRTYVVPITYAWDGTYVYAHSAEGLEVHMMRANPSVCFEVDEMVDLANWPSVIAWGTFEELAGEAAGHGMRTLIERVRPLLVSETATPSHGLGHPGAAGHAGADGRGLRTPVAFRPRLTEKTGRFERR